MFIVTRSPDNHLMAVVSRVGSYTIPDKIQTIELQNCNDPQQIA